MRSASWRKTVRSPQCCQTSLAVGKRILTPEGKDGDANGAVIKALIERQRAARQGHAAPFLSAFVALEGAGDLPRHAAMVRRRWTSRFTGRRQQLARTRDEGHRRHEMVSEIGREPHRRMVKDRPDWVLSRQRAWGVPLAIFVNKKTDRSLERRCGQRAHQVDAFKRRRGRVVQFAAVALPRRSYNADDYEQVKDILDVWFDSGSTHVFTVENPIESREWPQKRSRRSLSRRLRPASRLVPVVAARKLRHARPRAV